MVDANARDSSRAFCLAEGGGDGFRAAERHSYHIL